MNCNTWNTGGVQEGWGARDSKQLVIVDPLKREVKIIYLWPLFLSWSGPLCPKTTGTDAAAVAVVAAAAAVVVVAVVVGYGLKGGSDLSKSWGTSSFENLD